MDEISIRPVRVSDMAFILANWLNHYKNYSSFALRVPRALFFKYHQQIAKMILGRRTSKVLVATSSDDSDLILGFLVSEETEDGPIIHFLFIQKAFRKLGIAKALLQAAGIQSSQASFSHWTYDMDEIVKKNPTLVYNPYLI